ncbi:hypothetical protein D9615_010623 [Tricholomella constricta]|uniref:Uncharacterized protein n=1 Tax=Tricholomella constricta TaxID=117010 RepID=A0A8H5GKP5_9AGAR|nr:hypothetical protein D9615_010623 [Tricholomella constricta]
MKENGSGHNVTPPRLLIDHHSRQLQRRSRHWRRRTPRSLLCFWQSAFPSRVLRFSLGTFIDICPLPPLHFYFYFHFHFHPNIVSINNDGNSRRAAILASVDHHPDVRRAPRIRHRLPAACPVLGYVSSASAIPTPTLSPCPPATFSSAAVTWNIPELQQTMNWPFSLPQAGQDMCAIIADVVPILGLLTGLRAQNASLVYLQDLSHAFTTKLDGRTWSVYGSQG